MCSILDRLVEKLVVIERNHTNKMFEEKNEGHCTIDKLFIITK
jgi:hypothetical protein